MTTIFDRTVRIALRLYHSARWRLEHSAFFGGLIRRFHYNYLRYHGVELAGPDVTLVGLPIIRRKKNSRIVLGRRPWITVDR